LNILRLVLNEGLFHASLVGKKTHWISFVPRLLFEIYLCWLILFNS
jgi:hypothetical protein